ncbi:hypothetical protein F4818DRAFT_428557 [Hypoxylon cercidicola]|nr:hypothetical protein F4818DRAFT_428557 [Hypoxylon cercidicola]
MGFSVHQPALGSPLQFFPAMGSKQLDEMIDAYVPGNKSIQDKRAAVSMEFYQHVCQTGDMFKSFMVYPSLGSTSESPASSLLDSGYVSNFTSPIMSESQWAQASNASISSPRSHPRKSSSQKAASSTDFSHLPGMKIMTRDGKDVTNSASRGCKTKEQRDHAHLMRIIKACDACKKKKVRCDPSHKRSAGSSGAKTTKTTRKAKKAVTSTAPPAIAPQTTGSFGQSLFTSSFNSIDSINPASSFSFDSIMPESLVDPTTEWDQFFQYNDEPNEAIPVDYDFLYDPAGYFSPTSSNSLSSSQPITPVQTMGVESMGVSVGTAGAEAQTPLPPYLNPGGEAGNDYADFNLYSPGSSIGLDDDPTLTKDLAATSRPDYSEYLSHQRLYDGNRREIHPGQSQTPDSLLGISMNAGGQMSLFPQEEPFSSTALDSSVRYKNVSNKLTERPDATSGGSGLDSQVPEWHIPIALGRLDPWPEAEVDGSNSELRSASPLAEPSGTTRSCMSSLRSFGSQFRPNSPSAGLSSAKPTFTIERDQEDLNESWVATMTEGNDHSSARPTSSTSSASPRPKAFGRMLVASSTFEFRRRSQSFAASKSRILDETAKSQSTTRERGLTNGVSRSMFTAGRTTQSAKTTASRRYTSTSAGLNIWGSEHSTPTISNSGLALKSSAAANGTRLSTNAGIDNQNFTPLSKVGQGVMSSDVLFSTAATVVTTVATGAIAVHLLEIILDLARLVGTVYVVLVSLCLGVLGAVASEEARALPILSASPLAAVASIPIFKQPLSFLRRLPMAIMDDIKSTNHALFRKISSTQSNLERDDSFQPFGRPSLMTRLSRTTRPAFI